jgi:NOL1/NOP2/sun family putative RNA methylase
MKTEIPEAFKKRYGHLAGDREAFFSSLERRTPKSFRVNTLKSSVPQVKKRIESYGIGISQASWYPDAFVSEDPEIGSTLEHFLGCIYMQDLTSMLPAFVVRKELESAGLVLDACAAPGSKATQIAAFMQNKAILVANDLDYGRIKALKFNLEKCGVLNCIITNQDLRFFPEKVKFDVIVLDVPCSSEGTIRKNPRVLSMWSERDIMSKSGLQKKLLLKAWSLLASGGTLVYSTCTFAPEENEIVVSHLLEASQARIQEMRIPGLKCSAGIQEWEGKKFHPEISRCMRVWPHQNDTGGFFLAKVVKE